MREGRLRRNKTLPFYCVANVLLLGQDLACFERKEEINLNLFPLYLYVYEASYSKDLVNSLRIRYSSLFQAKE